MKQQTSSVYYDFCKMVANSWTYQRMTEEEKNRCWDALNFPVTQDHLKGTYITRWRILQSVYNAFLIGIGYTDGNWRKEKTV